MSKPITFRYIPATGDPNAGTYRTSYWIHDASGIEIHKGIDDSDGYDRIEWQIWTAGGPRAATSRGIGTRSTLNEAKDRARKLITEEQA